MQLGGTNAGVGRLLARNVSSPTGEFNPVCLGSTTESLALHLCRELGVETSVARIIPDYGRPEYSTTWEEHVWSCPGTTAPDGHLTGCTLGPANRFGCNVATAVGLDCRDDSRVPLGPASGMQFAFGGINGAPTTLFASRSTPS